MDRDEGGSTGTGTKRRSLFGWLGELLLTALAVFGVVCVGAAVAAGVFGVNIMLFKTGSMSPEIPAGSVALVREIPAAEAAVGDVITVQRENKLPVTHRVISNDPDPAAAPGGRIIRTKGDANPLPDPQAFHVSEVQGLFWSRPGWGEVFVRLADPVVLGIVTVLASGIVTWAFWPREKTVNNLSV